MLRRRNKHKRAVVALMLAASLIAGSGTPGSDAGTAAYAAETAPVPQAAASKTSSGVITNFEPFYADIQADWKKKGYNAAGTTYRINGADIAAQSPNQLAGPASFQGKDRALVWKSDRNNWIEYKVRVDEEGLYQFNLHYFPYTAPNETQLNRTPTLLSVAIDGNFPFREARAVPFRRLFKDQLPVKKDDKGDDIRPRSLAVSRWLEEPFRDSTNAYNGPLQWYLAKGEHTIRLSGAEPIIISELTILPPDRYVDYQQYASQFSAVPAVSGKAVTIQAEEVSSKNDAAIQMSVDKDALSLPEAGRYETFNTIGGGGRWINGGQKISWSFQVPETGRYQIAMRANQNTISDMSSYRMIELDGKVPFKEMTEYLFPYSPSWQGITLSDAASKPYDFYLEKGEHVLSMTATMSPFQPVVIESETASSLLRELTAELKSLTGNIVDKNRTWKIQSDFPELPKKLQSVRDQMQMMADDMLRVNGRRDSTVQTLTNAIKELNSYLRYPNEIPYHTDEIAGMQEKIGSIRDTLMKSPLQLDQIHIFPTGSTPPRMKANFAEKTKANTLNFFRSFIRKDDLTNLDKESLNVWVNRGRDWVNLLQELSNETFTPQTGIKVKVNLLPDENLLIYANAAGISPDIALGQPQDKSIDFAMRGALEDLSQFPDFKEIADKFAPGAMLPFYYDKGYYALPETQSFKVLFYRKDILERLRLKVPDTWEDVYSMLPTLQQNGYNFYVPPGDYITFLYQNGAEFFKQDGMATALNTPEAFKGFKQWTDLFNIYDLEKSVPSFYQHFRKGDMPIGIADYNTYITLAAAAPELSGWWGIAPLPGNKNTSGVVERWSSGGQSTAFMYKSSKKKEEAWMFLKWLLSAETQGRYGNDLESFNGITFRYNTANIEAFTKLPWPKDDLQVILEQWKWYKEMANPPGAYFVGRELNNAWNRTVVGQENYVNGKKATVLQNYRESLDESIVNIDREMIRKTQEFGFRTADGKVLHQLDLPQVKKPWEGVERYVTK